MKQLEHTLILSIFLASFLGGCGEKEVIKNEENYLITDTLLAMDNSIWQISDGWSNGIPFLSGWCAENIVFDSVGMNIELETRSCSGEAYASGEYRTQELFSYGRVEVEMKAARGDGIVSSLFFYTGESDGNVHEEIDVEILGIDPSKMQVNYWTEESGIEQEHPTFVDLGFDASQDYNLYAIEWRVNSINWYVNNILVHTEDGSKGPLPKLNMRMFVNLWACNASIWCGNFDNTILPVQANYRNFKYIKY